MNNKNKPGVLHDYFPTEKHSNATSEEGSRKCPMSREGSTDCNVIGWAAGGASVKLQKTAVVRSGLWTWPSCGNEQEGYLSLQTFSSLFHVQAYTEGEVESFFGEIFINNWWWAYFNES